MPANMSRAHGSGVQRRRVARAQSATNVENEADDEYASRARAQSATNVCNDADEEYASRASAQSATNVDNEADDEYASGAGIATTDVCNDADEEDASSAGITTDVCNDADDEFTRFIMLSQYFFSSSVCCWIKELSRSMPANAAAAMSASTTSTT
jgi:hypothetical protein